MDMSPAYRKGQRDHLPRAHVTFDRFHVGKLLNQAVDQVRRAERKEAPELARTRYLWLRNASSLSRAQQRVLESLLLDRTHLPFQSFWDLPAAEASWFLRARCRWARERGLEPMIRFARTVEIHREGILRWLRTRISNGLLECLSSLVQATKARARGYRSSRNLIAMIYLIHGKLPILQPG